MEGSGGIHACLRVAICESLMSIVVMADGHTVVFQSLGISGVKMLFDGCEDVCRVGCFQETQ